ncbi:type II toxin-antitoxin system RelE family toxin [Hyphomicrobium denitrificans]|uniref:type II toxin-antitoxin system RelE family toxin n=1 Tax=Hyphomicrobium denitrificans TaxID=53399 RepID=UPI003D77196D
MASCHVHLARAVVRELKKFPRKVQENLIAHLDRLEEAPRPPGVEKLSDQPGFFRVRVGDYRIVYAIPKPQLLVVCLIGDRKNVYRAVYRLNATLDHAMQELHDRPQVDQQSSRKS